MVHVLKALTRFWQIPTYKNSVRAKSVTIVVCCNNVEISSYTLIARPTRTWLEV